MQTGENCIGETANKLLDLLSDKRQSEDLRAFREWTRENLDEKDIVTKKAVDSYLESL